MISSQINKTTFLIFCWMIHISQTGPCSFQCQIFTCSESTVSPNTIFRIQNNTLLFKPTSCSGTYFLLSLFNIWYNDLKPFSWAFLFAKFIFICVQNPTISGLGICHKPCIVTLVNQCIVWHVISQILRKWLFNLNVIWDGAADVATD